MEFFQCYNADRSLKESVSKLRKPAKVTYDRAVGSSLMSRMNIYFGNGSVPTLNRGTITVAISDKREHTIILELVVFDFFCVLEYWSQHKPLCSSKVVDPVSIPTLHTFDGLLWM